MNNNDTVFFGNIQDQAFHNQDFRRVIFTGKHMQLVLMTLKPGEEIGKEIHNHVDQFFRVESGKAKFIIDGAEYIAEDDFAVIVPAGAEHNIINDSNEDLRLYTIYSPANHPAGTVHKNKSEADAAEIDHKQS